MEGGYDICAVHELPDLRDVDTTMIYTHVLTGGTSRGRSRVDGR